MAATIEIKIDDPGDGRGTGAGDSGAAPVPPAPPRRPRAPAGSPFGGGDDPLTPIEALRRARQRRLGTDDEGSFNNPLAVGQQQRRQRLNRIRRGAKAGQKSEQNELQLIRVQRAAERKLEQQRQKRERQQEMERRRRERQAEMEQSRRQREAASAARAKSQRAAQYAQIAVTASRGGPSALANAGSAVGSIAGAALGGPVGAVIGEQVGKQIGEKIQNPFARFTGALDTATKAVGVVGQAAVKVAGNDGVGALTGVANTVADGLEEIPVAGKLAASSIRAFTTSVDTLTGVVGAFNERGRQLAGFNGNLAAATAQQDVTRVIADIREANRVDYGPLIKKQTEFEETVKSIVTPIKEEIVVVLPKLLELLITLAESSTASASAVFSDSETLRKIANEVQRTRRDAELARAGIPDPLAAWLFGVAPGAGAIPAPVPAPGALRVPILGAP